MKKILTLIITICASASIFAKSSGASVEVNPGGWLDVDGVPMIILGGELANSAATCDEDIRRTVERLSGKGLNTVLVPAYWELTEPQKGKFDFFLIDTVIDTAVSNGMKVVFLWFGAWKNSMSCYAPEWVKRDFKKYPRARTESGKPLEILSAFSDDVADADLKAFKALLNHIKSYDNDGTVIMVQVENEIGMLESARDFSDAANKEYGKGVPKELMAYLKANKKNLHPGMLEKWGANGFKTSGSWGEVFGDDIYTDEYFMAWNYAKYVEKLVSEGKKILKVPFYLNAALNSRGRKPGEYPSAGPLAHLKDIWHAGAPSVSFLSPDIYDSGFEDWVGRYALPDNVLFIPEVKRDRNNGAQAYYVVGHHNAMGISPFSIEKGDARYFDDLQKAYSVIEEFTPALVKHGRKGLREGVLLSADNPSAMISDGQTRITLSHYFTLPWDSRASDKANWNETGAILLKIAEGEYLLAGSGIVVRFEDERENHTTANLGEDGFADAGGRNAKIPVAGGKTPRVGLATVEEVKINPDGSFSRVRTFNGDETHQGRHVRIGVDDHKILHIKTYKYE